MSRPLERRNGLLHTYALCREAAAEGGCMGRRVGWSDMDGARST